MASRSLGIIRIDLLAVTAKFETGIKGAIAHMSKFGTSFGRMSQTIGSFGKKIVGAFTSIGARLLSIKNLITGAVIALAGARMVGAFQEAAETVDTIGKKAKTVGMTVEQMSVLRLTADEAGVEFETLSKLSGKALKNIQTFAATGGGPAADALRRMKLQLTDSNGAVRSIGDLLPDIARKLSGMAQGDKLRFAESIFGREGGSQFVQMLEDSGDLMTALGDQTDRARKLGVYFTESQFKKLKDYNDAVGRIGQAWLGFRVSIMAELAPLLTDVSNWFAETLAAAGRWSGNFISVVRAAFSGLDINGEGVNVALQAIKSLVGNFFDVIREETWGRIKQFAVQTWAFIKIAAKDLLGKIGELLTGAAESIGGVIGSILGGIGKAIVYLVDKLGPYLQVIGAAIKQEWKEAGEAVEDYTEELAQNRRAAHAVFGVSINWINTLGDKYRKLRGEAEEASGAFNAGPEEETISKWKEFFEGMKAGWESLADEVEDFRGLGQTVISDFSHGIAGGFAGALAKGEMSLKNFGKTALKTFGDVMQSVVETILKFLILRAVVAAMGGLFGGAAMGAESGLGNTPNYGGSTPTYAAKGRVFQFAKGGVLGGPTPFGFKKEHGVAGERGAGTEVGFAPLRRIGGEVGVKSVGGGVTFQLFDQRSGGEPAEVQQGRGGDGRQFFRIVIRDEVRKMAGDGMLDKTMAGNFGVKRQGLRR